jgi:hypothetical protein
MAQARAQASCADWHMYASLVDNVSLRQNHMIAQQLDATGCDQAGA